MKQTVEEYVKHALAYFPFIPIDQLISMVVLHFDIPYTEAKQQVENIINSRNRIENKS